MHYFKDCETVEQVKSLYRVLAKANHPDLGGDTATMQAVNDQYKRALASLDGQVSKDDQGIEHTYKYREALEQALIDKIAELLALQMVDVEIWLIGVWVWVIGTTKPYKEQLGKNGLGLIWHSTRNAWYFKVGTWSGGKSNGSLANLAGKYGAEELKQQAANKSKALSR
jgi:hypothetical protein